MYLSIVDCLGKTRLRVVRHKMLISYFNLADVIHNRLTYIFLLVFRKIIPHMYFTFAFVSFTHTVQLLSAAFLLQEVRALDKHKEK